MEDEMCTFDPTRQPHDVHPEQKQDEIYIGDYDAWFAHSDRIRWRSKRIGANPLNPTPVRVHEAYRTVPVFAKRNEVLQRHYHERFGA